MKNESKLINFTKNRKDIADFLCTTNQVSLSDIKLYTQLYEKDYPYPVKTSWYKELSIIFVIITLALQLFTPIFKEYISLLLDLGLIALLLLSFGFVRKVKYPNEEYSVLSLIVVSLIGALLLVISFFNKESLISNWYFLNVSFNKGNIKTAFYNTINNSTLVFFFVSCGLTLASILFGVLIGRRRLESIMAPMISVVGLMLFCFISNLSLDKNLLDTFYNPAEGTDKLYAFYLIMIGACAALVAFDIALIIIIRLIGGKKSIERR